MKIALLMRVYNEPKILMDFSVKSILKQTHGDFRLYIYRDGGKPIPWIDEYNDERIVYMECDDNHGRAFAANALLGMVEDDIEAITFFDADGDQVGERFLEESACYIDAVNDVDFWWVRPTRMYGAVEERMIAKARLADAFLRNEHFDESSFLFEKYFQTRTNYPDGSLVGHMGLFLPRDARNVKVDNFIGAGEDHNWTMNVQVWAMREHGLWRGGRCKGCSFYGSKDAAVFYFESDYNKKYCEETSFEDVFGGFSYPSDVRMLTEEEAFAFCDKYDAVRVAWLAKEKKNGRYW